MSLHQLRAREFGSDEEAKRLVALQRYHILDTPPDGTFDRITAIAARLFSVPISIISLVDRDRIWFKSHHGIDVQQIARTPGLCASAILQRAPWILTDAKIDPRSRANPLVAGDFGLRFYVGVPLKTHDGYNVGTLCVIDRAPHTVTDEQIAHLTDLAAIVMDQMELRRSVRARLAAETVQRDTERQSRALLDALPVAVYTTDAEGRITYYNEAAVELSGRRPELGSDQWCVTWRLYWPDGTPLPHDECPMAVTLKENRPVRGLEAVAERPDGTRVPFLPYPTPLHDASGRLIGAINMLADISERKRVEAYEQRLISIIESSEDAILSEDLDGIITSYNRAAERLFGYTAEEVIGKSIGVLIPQERADEELKILARIRRGEHIDHHETVRRRKDGSLVDVSLTVSPVRNAGGTIVGASKIARDITERKRAQAHQELLLREMNHRVKNLFAIANGVVTLSGHSARTPQEATKTIRGRLDALARAHELVIPAGGAMVNCKAATVDALVRTICSPYFDRDCPERITLEGPSVQMSGHAVTSLALILHELATNAAKYGALSSLSGRIDVVWSQRDDKFHMTWREHGGPAFDGCPIGEGFGTLLVRRSVEDQLGGAISYQWKSEGVIVHLSVPAERLVEREL